MLKQEWSVVEGTINNIMFGPRKERQNEEVKTANVRMKSIILLLPQTDGDPDDPEIHPAPSCFLQFNSSV
ncbi:hypothetical protein Q8A67_023466 [Cirrhinus molitorella]|uniref:Uncharacterized protein n=1 Tax=Cirrhinus molitorella TaxID=172907 RepID=A0AA88TKX6_9TELE|nr:hypothetical protein Q8A67_023466 [Cirrhinus molitorella]